MIIDAGNGPHRRENKIISHSFCKSAKARIKRDLCYISSLRTASANDCVFSLLSDVRRDYIYRYIYMRESRRI